MELKKELNKTPTLTELKDAYGDAFIGHIHKRYASYISFCKNLDLIPNFSNYNPKYSKEYFIEKGMSNFPSIRILTRNESRALYRYFKGGVKEWKNEIKLKKSRGKLKSE